MQSQRSTSLCKKPHAFLLGSGAGLVSYCRAPASLFNWNPKTKRGNFGNIIKLVLIILCVLGCLQFYDHDEPEAIRTRSIITVSRTKIQHRANSLHLTTSERNDNLYYKNVQRANLNDYRAVVGNLKKIGPIPRTFQLIKQLYEYTLFYLAE